MRSLSSEAQAWKTDLDPSLHPGSPPGCHYPDGLGSPVGVWAAARAGGNEASSNFGLDRHANSHSNGDVHTHSHSYRYAYLHVYTYVHPYAHTNFHIYTHVHPYAHTNIHPYVQPYVYPYLHTYPHRYLPPYPNSQANSCRLHRATGR
jgi:hypothetical protein